jgi:hypothetical protein
VVFTVVKLDAEVALTNAAQPATNSSRASPRASGNGEAGKSVNMSRRVAKFVR